MFLICCCGQTRYDENCDGDKKFCAFLMNLIIGLSQFSTIIFCLVGWCWSVGWGITLISVSSKYFFKCVQQQNIFVPPRKILSNFTTKRAIMQKAAAAAAILEIFWPENNFMKYSRSDTRQMDPNKIDDFYEETTTLFLLCRGRHFRLCWLWPRYFRKRKINRSIFQFSRKMHSCSFLSFTDFFQENKKRSFKFLYFKNIYIYFIKQFWLW